MISKEELRKSINELRRSLKDNEVETISIDICKIISKIDIYQKSSKILVYSSINNEVKLDFLVEMALKEGKKVYFPKVNGDKMEFYRINLLAELEVGEFSILEPSVCADVYEGDSISCVFVPGTVFGHDFHRIGYGGGYYDRYLAKHSELTKIGVCYECQMKDEIPFNDFDIDLDIIVNQKEVLYNK